jgi:hypothetical protein
MRPKNVIKELCLFPFKAFGTTQIYTSSFLLSRILLLISINFQLQPASEAFDKAVRFIRINSWEEAL